MAISESSKPVVTRTRTCVQCGRAFTYEIRRGSDRRYCSDFCRTQRRHATAKTRPLCVVPGCQNLRGGYRSGICNSCYYRLKRTRSLDKRAWKYRALSSHGYVALYKREHPLATASGFVYEHRQVLYDAIGSGPHACRWCGTPVDWIKGRCIRGALVPDHIDGVKTNNALDNLVPACNSCNVARGLFMAWVRRHQDDPFLWALYNQVRRKNGA